MNLDSIQNTLLILTEKIVDKITSSHLYNKLIEKYHHLPASGQRWILISLSSSVVILLLSFPVSMLIQSKNLMQDFKEKKQITLALIKKPLSSLNPSFLSPGVFNEQVSSLVKSLDLSPSQPVKIRSAKSPSFSKPLSKLSSLSKSIDISGLNIQEIIEVAHKIESLAPSIKVHRLNIKELKDKENYYRAIYTIVFFYPSSKKS